MPVLFTWMDFVKFGFVNVTGFYEILDQTIRSATGVYPVRHLGWLPGWEEICYPTNNPAARQPPMRWAQFMLLGHGAFAYFCIMRGQYLAPVLLSLGPFYNGWLFWLCNSTQHIGLPHGNFGTETVNDFRLNTRTFYLNNSLVRLLVFAAWWKMKSQSLDNSIRPDRGGASDKNDNRLVVLF